MSKKYVVCYSGGHSSALCAIETQRKHGSQNVILLNHNISSHVEHQDIKRFKDEVSNYLNIPITYANHKTWEQSTPIKVSLKSKAFKGVSGYSICTHRLKTEPFKRWMKQNDPNKQYVYIYGFDKTKSELKRANRRSQIMGIDGYKTEFPLINWERTIYSTEEINIKPPMSYEMFKHANCLGCLKAGWAHWYAVYCLRPDIWQEAKNAEDEIGYSIHKGKIFLEDKEELFKQMKDVGVVPTEHVSPSKFWNDAKKKVKDNRLCALEKYDETVCSECS